MAETYGWTLEYIDSLSYADVQERVQYLDGLGKARGSILK